MQITKLHIENFMRVKAIDITPADGAVILTGKNGNGKSSVLNAIWAALQNAEAAKTIHCPVRAGESKAAVVVELGDIVVTRSWTSDDKSYLKVESKDGARYGRPQEMLDNLVGALSFDPLAFGAMDEKSQLRELMKLVNLPVPLETLDAKRKLAYDERTQVNRELKAAEIRASSVQFTDGLPDSPVTSTDILAELKAANDHNRAVEKNQQAIDEAGKKIDELEKLIDELKRRIELAQNDMHQLCGVRARLAKDPESPVDTAAIEARLASIEQTNERIRSNQERARQLAEVERIKKKVDSLTATIDGFDKQKTDMLAEAALPVDGLSFDSERIYFNSIPFSQCSASEQLRVSMGILIASNPKLKVVRLMNNSFNLMDADRKEVFLQAMEAYGMQAWIESNSADDGGIVIEDGQIA